MDLFHPFKIFLTKKNGVLVGFFMSNLFPRSFGYALKKMDLGFQYSFLKLLCILIHER